MSLSQDHSVRYALAAGLVGTATGLILYGVFASRSDRHSVSGLHRSNAVSRRASARHSTSQDTARTSPSGMAQADGASTDIPQSLRGSQALDASMEADDNLTEDEYVSSYPDVDAEQVAANSAPGQRLKELAFAIASNNARIENTVHHGVCCDSCMETPIRGVRFRCANCEDFDLCEKCEAVVGHFPTHVLLKLRLPVRTMRGLPIPVWYPGNILELPRTLPDNICKDLLKRYKRRLGSADCRPDEDSLKAAYERFVCLANVAYPDDSCSLGRGVDETAFASLIPNMYRPSFVASLLFRFYDIRDHGILGFDELVYGSFIILHEPRRSAHFMTRTFKCLDVDKDGYLSRQDLLQVFRACFEFNQDAATHMMHDVEAENLTEGRHYYKRHYIEGAGSLGAYYKEFSDGGPHFGVLSNEGKENFSSGVNSGQVSQDSAAERTWLPLEDELAEELERITVKDAPDARFGVGRDVHRSDGIPRPYVCLAGSRFFINISSNLDQRPCYYVKLDLTKDQDLLNDLKRGLKPDGSLEQWEPDLETVGKVRHQMRSRLMEHIKAKRADRMNLRKSLHQFTPEDKIAQAGPQCSSTEHAAVGTVYALVQEAFNELLDPIFLQREYNHARAEHALPLRIHFAAEVDAIIEVLRDAGKLKDVDDAQRGSGPILAPGDRKRMHPLLVGRLRAVNATDDSWSSLKERAEALEARGWRTESNGDPDNAQQVERTLEAGRDALELAPTQPRVEDDQLEWLLVDRLLELATWERQARISAVRGAPLDKLSRVEWERLLCADENGRSGSPAPWKWVWSFLFIAVF